MEELGPKATYTERPSTASKCEGMPVAVLMPVFDAGKYLAQAIESVLQQTHTDFELIIVDDGSTDESSDICKYYMQKDSRVTLVSQPNSGMAAALNRGLFLARTDWVFRMDADDVMLPTRLERQLDFIARHPLVKVTSCEARYIDAQGKVFGKTANDIKDVEAFYRSQRTGSVIGLLHPGVAMHRQTALEVGGYRGKFWPADDIDLWNRIAEAGHMILVQDEVLLYYRIHKSSAITSDFKKARLKLEWVKACMMARGKNYPEPDWNEFIQLWNDCTYWRRINRSRKVNAKYLYRKAGYDLLAGRFLQASIAIVGAAMLQPTYVLRRMRRQVFERI